MIKGGGEDNGINAYIQSNDKGLCKEDGILNDLC